MHHDKLKVFPARLLLMMTLLLLLTACDQGYSLAKKAKNHLQTAWQTMTGHTPENIDIQMVSGVETISEIAYGAHKKQCLDVYKLAGVQDAPIIMHLHGGGWSSGSKREPLSYINKVNRWVPKGFIVISVDTRIMPEADVYGQVDDLAKAVAYVQKHAPEWGGDGSKLMLMGHSSAGTMVSVLAAKPALVEAQGGQRWLASFAIDSSSLDIARTMRLWSPEMFIYAYGNDAQNWSAASPISLLSKESLPMFIACSTQRGDGSCEQATLFAEEARKFNLVTKVSPQDFDHGGVDFNLGFDGAYTDVAETFMASLDAEVALRLKKNAEP